MNAAIRMIEERDQAEARTLLEREPIVARLELERDPRRWPSESERYYTALGVLLEESVRGLIREWQAPLSTAVDKAIHKARREMSVSK